MKRRITSEDEEYTRGCWFDLDGEKSSSIHSSNQVQE
jgi:hypothetical protein